MMCECRQSFVRRQESSVVFTMANSIDLKSTVTLKKTKQKKNGEHYYTGGL